MSRDDALARELSAALTDMHRRITQEYSAKIADLEAAVRAQSTRNAALEKRIAALERAPKQELAKRDDSAIIMKIDQLAELTDQKIKDIVPIVTDRASAQVLTVVKRDIVPVVNKAVTWLAYHTQDTDGLMNEYRRAVMDNRDDTEQIGNFTLAYK